MQEGREAVHLEATAQIFDGGSSSPGHRKPVSTRFAHLFVVSLHGFFFIVCTQEDDLELVLQLRPWWTSLKRLLETPVSKPLNALVPLGELLGEFAAWRTPVGAKVEAQMLPFLAKKRPR